jgi:hypothetical protein
LGNTGPVTIGRPLRGYTLQNLDKQQRSVSRGNSGEVDAVDLAREYLNYLELTCKAFLSAESVDGGQYDMSRCDLFLTR